VQRDSVVLRIGGAGAFRSAVGALNLHRESRHEAISQDKCCGGADLRAESASMAKSHHRSWFASAGAELLGKLQKPTDISTAEAVDGLIVITDRNDAAGGPYERLEQLHLERIGVLIFVDEHRSISGV